MCGQPEKSFQEAFICFIGRRVCEDIVQLYLNNSEYIQLGSDIDACSEKIMSFVQEEKRKEFEQLLDKYIDMNGQREELVNEILYSQGLKDGISLGHILEIGKGVFGV